MSPVCRASRRSAFGVVAGRFARGQPGVLPHERGKGGGDPLHRLGTPVGVGRQILRVARGAGAGEIARRIEHQHPVAPQLVEQRVVGQVVQRTRVASAGTSGQTIGMDRGLHRRGHEHQSDAARREVACELTNGRTRVRLRRGLVFGRRRDAALQLARFEKPAAGHVFDIRTVEQPPVAADIHALVARPKPAAQPPLRRRPQQPSHGRPILERRFERVDLREHDPVRRHQPVPSRRGRTWRTRRTRRTQRTQRTPELNERQHRKHQQKRRDHRLRHAPADVGVADFDARNLLAIERRNRAIRADVVGGHQKMK